MAQVGSRHVEDSADTSVQDHLRGGPTHPPGRKRDLARPLSTVLSQGTCVRGHGRFPPSRPARWLPTRVTARCVRRWPGPGARPRPQVAAARLRAARGHHERRQGCGCLRSTSGSTAFIRMSRSACSARS